MSESGLKVMGRNKGAFCLLCGDYWHHADRADAQRSETLGCERCKPRFEQHKKIGWSNRIVKGDLIFNGEQDEK